MTFGHPESTRYGTADELAYLAGLGTWRGGPHGPRTLVKDGLSQADRLRRYLRVHDARPVSTWGLVNHHEVRQWVVREIMRLEYRPAQAAV